MSTLPLPMAAFVAGLVSFLSPCVLPLVPGYVSLISGAGVEELQAQQSGLMRKVMLNSIAFILGFSVVIILFGLHLTGLLRIRYLYADKRLHSVKGGATVWGAFVIGFAFAFGWTP